MELLQQLDFPLVAPSANPSGYMSPTRAGHVLEGLGDRIDYILDGGPSASDWNPPSFFLFSNPNPYCFVTAEYRWN